MPHLLLRHRTWPLSRIVFDGLGLSSRIGSDLARVGRVQGQPILTHASSVSLGHIRQDQVIRYRKHSLPHAYLFLSLTDFSSFVAVSFLSLTFRSFLVCLCFTLSLSFSLAVFHSLSAPCPVLSTSSSHFHIYLSCLGSLGKKNRHALTGPFVHGWVECAYTLLASAAAFAQTQSA